MNKEMSHSQLREYGFRYTNKAKVEDAPLALSF